MACVRLEPRLIVGLTLVVLTVTCQQPQPGGTAGGQSMTGATVLDRATEAGTTVNGGRMLSVRLGHRCTDEFTDEARHQSGAGCVEGNPAAVEYVQVGDHAWVRFSASGPWTSGARVVFPGTTNPFRSNLVAGWRDPAARAEAKVDAVDCKGAPCWHVTFAAEGGAAAEWWFDQQTYLPIRQLVTSPSGTESREWTDLNGRIAISPPT
jgi:hypothetical protein